MASVDEVGDEAGCYGAVEAVFEEASVGAAFAGCVAAVAVVYKDFHFRWVYGVVSMLRGRGPR